MYSDIQAAIPLGFFLSFMIGPVFFVLLETAALKGFKAALVFNLGVILADIIFISAAYFSSLQLLENLNNQPGIYIFGGLVLFIYGATIAFKKEVPLSESPVKVTKSHYVGLFVKGFLLNFINIGVLVFWLGVIIIIGPNLNNDPQRMTVFFSTMIGAYFVTDLVKIILAKQLKNKLTPRRVHYVKKVIGVILILSGIILCVKGFLPKSSLNIDKGIEIIA
ncbi:MAG: LysE family transporter [Flavobacteriaceae bacterium]|nr:LysE family transporter [Flavobacteriaceae bacterium]MDG2318114.1 LysE family transporter [Flavobacteriaceae bacterium]